MRWEGSCVNVLTTKIFGFLLSSEVTWVIFSIKRDAFFQTTASLFLPSGDLDTSFGPISSDRHSRYRWNHIISWIIGGVLGDACLDGGVGLDLPVGQA